MKMPNCLYTTRHQERRIALTASYSLPAIAFFLKPSITPMDILYVFGAIIALTYLFEVAWGFRDELFQDITPNGTMNLGILVTSLVTGVIGAIAFGVQSGMIGSMVGGFGLAIAFYGMMRLIMPLEFGMG